MYLYICRFLSSPMEAGAGPGQRCAAGAAEHPRAPRPPGFSGAHPRPRNFTHPHPPAPPSIICDALILARGQRFLLLFPPRPPASLSFFPLLPWLVPHWNHPGKIQKCKSEAKTPGNPRNFKAMFPITRKEREASN